MSKRLFISNLPFTMELEALESALTDVLSAFGKVVSQRLVFEGTTLRPKGLCFVEMATPQEAQEAIHSLEGIKVAGYRLKTGEAGPRICTRKPRRVRAHSPAGPSGRKRHRPPMG